MIEKVNPSHPDKVADRIAGAIVDLAYKTEHDPKIAVEVLIGHGKSRARPGRARSSRSTRRASGFA